MLRRDALLALILPLMAMAQPALAQYKSSSQYGTGGVQTPPTNLPPALRPQVNIPAQAASHFEENPVLSIPKAFARQWWPGTEIPPEALISERYLRTQDT